MAWPPAAMTQIASAGASWATSVDSCPAGTISYVIRALADRDRTLTELAGLLGVSKQAAIKVVDEMEARGFLRRVPDADDRRVKALRLTVKGRKVRRAALAASHEMERGLRADVGDAAVDELRAALEALLERYGALEDAQSGRSRALW